MRCKRVARRCRHESAHVRTASMLVVPAEMVREVPAGQYVGNVVVDVLNEMASSWSTSSARACFSATAFGLTGAAPTRFTANAARSSLVSIMFAEVL